MTTEIVVKALDEAILNRNIGEGIILHTDLRSQYISNEYEEKLKALNIRHSDSLFGCPYDNVGIESFHTLLKKEHVYQRPIYQNFEEAKLQTFSYVQGFYNNRRMHSALTYLSPAEFKQKILAAQHKKSLAKSVSSIDADPLGEIPFYFSNNYFTLTHNNSKNEV